MVLFDELAIKKQVQDLYRAGPRDVVFEISASEMLQKCCIPAAEILLTCCYPAAKILLTGCCPAAEELQNHL